MRAEAVILAGSLVLGGCATRLGPEGSGGWSAERRLEEVAAASRKAGGRFHEPERPAPDAVAAPLDLATVVELAARENDRLASARAGRDASAAGVTRAIGRFLPVTTVDARYAWHTDRRTNEVDVMPGPGGPGGARPSVTIREAEEGTASATVELPLDWSGELRHALAAAQAGYRGEAARVASLELAEQAEAVGAYFGVLEARSLIGVADERIRVLEEQLGYAQRRFDHGRITRNELLVVEVALRNARHERFRHEQALAAGRRRLNHVIGAPIGAPTEVADVAAAPGAPTLASVTAAAPAHNPVLRRLLEERQALEAKERSLGRSRFPRLVAGGRAEATDAEVFEPRESATGFVGLRWDLGTDLRREAAITETRHLARRNRAELENELRGLERSLAAVLDALEERIRAVAVARAGVAQAEENLRIRREQFGAGRATSDDVLDAEALLASERAAAASALYQSHVRRAELLTLVGLSPADPFPAGEGGPNP